MPIQISDSEVNINNYNFDINKFSDSMEQLTENLSDDDNIKSSDFVLNVIRAYGVTGEQIPRTLLNKMAYDLQTKKDDFPTIVAYTIDFALSFIMLTIIKKTNNSPDADTGELVPHMNECWTNILNLLRSVPDNPDDE